MRFTSAFIVSLVLCSNLVSAADWPSWRGPAYNGSSPERNLPVSFSTTENVKWKTALPGPSAATPVIWGDRVYVSSTNADNNLLALCLDRSGGKVLWQKKLGHGAPLDSRANQSCSSPVTDGQRVVFLYATGDFVCFTLDGKLLWKHRISEMYGDFAFQWTFSASPTILDDRVYLPILQRDTQVRGRGGKGPGQPIPSLIVCLDAKSGKVIFEQSRTSKARVESKESYTTLIPFEHDGREELILAGGDCLTGHDPVSGKELWRWGTWNPRRIPHWRLVPSAVAGDGMVLVCAPKGDPVYAVKAGLKGDRSGEKAAWVSQDRKISSDVCTPAYHDGHFYVLHDKSRDLTKVVARSGKTIWQIKLPGRALVRASPTVADGKVYCLDHDGLAMVVNAADGKILHRAAMAAEGEERIRSTIAVAGGNLFIRTNKHLYCIGK